MIFSPDPASNVSLMSQYTQWNPRVPFSLHVPPDFCQTNEQKLMVLGKVKAGYARQPVIQFTDTQQGR